MKIENIRKKYTEYNYKSQVELQRNSLQALAEKLFTSKVHFVFELIQNADDNNYNKG